MLEHRDLHDDKTGNDQSRRNTREHAQFAAHEDRYRGYERTPTDTNHQDNRGNGIIAERRVLEPFQRELTSPSRFYQDAILVGAVQYNDPAPIADSALKAASTPIEIRTSLCFIILLHEHSVKTSSSPRSRSVSALASRFGGRCFLTVAHAVTYADSLVYARAG